MFSITLLRWMTLSSILFWFAVYWQGGKKVLIDIRQSLQSKVSGLDTALLIVITLCSVTVVALGALATLGLMPILLSQHSAFAFIGMLLSISSILGMFYCRSHLGLFWTAETSLSRGHQIVEAGPYHVVRHPIYAFAILMYIGFGLVFLSPLNATLVSVIVAAYIFKAKDEDQYLEQNLAGYRAYQQRVRYRLIPGLW